MLTQTNIYFQQTDVLKCLVVFWHKSRRVAFLLRHSIYICADLQTRFDHFFFIFLQSKMARKKAREEDKRQASLMEETASEAEDDVSVKHNGDYFFRFNVNLRILFWESTCVASQEV